jgi:hypothetical protein
MEHIKVGKNKKILCVSYKVGGIYRSFATTVSKLKICDFFFFFFLNVWKCYNFL